MPDDRSDTLLRFAEQIARVDTSLGIVGQTMGQLRDEFRAINEQAAAHRREIQEAVSSMDRRLHQAEADVKALTDVVAKIAPFAEKLDRWEQRGIGAVAVLVTIGGFIGAGVAAFWSKLLAFLFS